MTKSKEKRGLDGFTGVNTTLSSLGEHDECSATEDSITPETQCQKMVEWMDEHGSISTREAMRNLEIMRPASRICDLRKAGWDIETIMVQGLRSRYARYRIVSRPEVTESEGV